MRRTPAHPSPSRRSAPAAGRLGALAVTALLAAVGALASSGGCTRGTPDTAGADAGDCLGAEFVGSPLSIRCGALVDDDGRQVWLHGVNARVEGLFDVTFDDGRVPLEPIPDFTEADATNIRSLGLNALRLPINWSGLEPTETGGFSAPYLERIAQIVGFARDAGLFVLLDLHQDAYSKEIGEDGAPYWAISPPPPERLQGPLDDLEARRLSKPVKDAFETFFGPSAEGARLRARFAKAAARVASRFASDTAVGGLELFNEPLGTDEQLTAFHTEVLAEVRAAAPKKLVFFEPSALRNLTDRASIPARPLGPGTVYAPHVYTLAFTGTPSSIAAMTKETLRPSNENARAEADGWQTPLVIGEFGFSPASPAFADYIAWQSELQDEVRASSFLWVWKETSQGAWGVYDRVGTKWEERPAVVSALTRLRLERVAGRLGRVGYDREKRRLAFTFEGGAAGGRNVISAGRLAGTVDAKCDGRSVAAEGKGPLEIPCGGPGSHEVLVTVIPR
ncbi:MAG TPA: cellulase family glycosylhydrolase [Polyangiaceae bacterium]|nr:cellulase family glycosylhydrolase [Polyangiaceae bacterium]